MTGRIITHPDGRRIHVGGRRRPIAHGPRFRLCNYTMASIPPPPLTTGYWDAAKVALENIYVNNRLGCCTISGRAHIEGTLTGNAGRPPLIYTDDQIVALYSAFGYSPNAPLDANGNNPTDQGADEVSVLNYWQNNPDPAGGSPISAWMEVDPANPREYKTAVWLFENLYFGVELPDAWVDPMPEGNFTWDVAGDPNEENGHCFVGVDNDPRGIISDTWGLKGLVTDAAVAKYASRAANGALYTIISRDGINKAKQRCPAGVDWSQMVADFDSMGGSVTA
jgi:hypothetical protein